MKYKIERTNKFTKQYTKILKQNEFKEEEFISVLKMLSNDEVLPKKYKNRLSKACSCIQFVINPKSNRNMGMSYTK